MTFQESIKACLSNYATFSGRATRSEFWWFFLFQILLGTALHFVLPRFGQNLVVFLLILPSLAVGARRLHDIGISGWWQLLMLTGIGWLPLLFLWAKKAKDDVPLLSAAPGQQT